MTLEQLRIFVAVAEREHVTNAARDLNLTQSATSAAVAALEARYATKLFDRVGRRIALTDAGHQAGVLPAGAAEAGQCVLGDVVPALHRNLLDRVGHVPDRDPDESFCHLFRCRRVAGRRTDLIGHF